MEFSPATECELAGLADVRCHYVLPQRAERAVGQTLFSAFFLVSAFFWAPQILSHFRQHVLCQTRIARSRTTRMIAL
jgi:hypothetical protein